MTDIVDALELLDSCVRDHGRNHRSPTRKESAASPIGGQDTGRAATDSIVTLKLTNYTNNWRRLGFSDEDLAGKGSDRLVEGLIAMGDAWQVATRITAHLDAGADHVCIQLIAQQNTDLLPGFADLADVLIA